MTAVRLCRTRPADWWDLGDDGNRLALALCRACPALAWCASTARREAGIIRAATAYGNDGRVLPLCPCGYPNRHVIDGHTGTRPALCHRCNPPRLRRWDISRKRYWAAYHQRRKARTDAAREATR